MSWYDGQIVKGPDNKPYRWLGLGHTDNPFGCVGLFENEQGEVIHVSGGVRQWYKKEACKCDSNSWRQGFTEYRDKDGKAVMMVSFELLKQAIEEGFICNGGMTWH